MPALLSPPKQLRNQAEAPRNVSLPRCTSPLPLLISGLAVSSLNPLPPTPPHTLRLPLSLACRGREGGRPSESTLMGFPQHLPGAALLPALQRVPGPGPLLILCVTADGKVSPGGHLSVPSPTLWRHTCFPNPHGCGGKTLCRHCPLLANCCGYVYVTSSDVNCPACCPSYRRCGSGMRACRKCPVVHTSRRPMRPSRLSREVGGLSG